MSCGVRTRGAVPLSHVLKELRRLSPRSPAEASISLDMFSACLQRPAFGLLGQGGAIHGSQACSSCAQPALSAVHRGSFAALVPKHPPAPATRQLGSDFLAPVGSKSSLRRPCSTSLFATHPHVAQRGSFGLRVTSQAKKVSSYEKNKNKPRAKPALKLRPDRAAADGRGERGRLIRTEAWEGPEELSRMGRDIFGTPLLGGKEKEATEAERIANAGRVAKRRIRAAQQEELEKEYQQAQRDRTRIRRQDRARTAAKRVRLEATLADMDAEEQLLAVQRRHAPAMLQGKEEEGAQARLEAEEELQLFDEWAAAKVAADPVNEPAVQELRHKRLQQLLLLQRLPQGAAGAGRDGGGTATIAKEEEEEQRKVPRARAAPAATAGVSAAQWLSQVGWSRAEAPARAPAAWVERPSAMSTLLASAAQPVPQPERGVMMMSTSSSPRAATSFASASVPTLAPDAPEDARGGRGGEGGGGEGESPGGPTESGRSSSGGSGGDGHALPGEALGGRARARERPPGGGGAGAVIAGTGAANLSGPLASTAFRPVLVRRGKELPANWNTPGGTVALIDKPKGWTSFAVCGKLRYTLKIQKVGHAGTLDPLATGLLIVCLGKATKLADSYQAMTKRYSGTVRLGEATPSLDADTPVSEAKPWEHIEQEQVDAAVQSAFLGDIMQVPPMYSAIKVKGEKMYDKARKGEHVELPPRPVHIYSFQLQRSPTNRQEMTFDVVCSKGTYIRSLLADLARALDSCAHLTELRREAIGEYSVKDAWTMPDLLDAIGQKQVASAGA
eukprot:jgi/Mesen1/8161/ME000438S07273